MKNLLFWIPLDLWQQFKAKCKSEPISMQRKFIELVKNYLEG